MLIVTFSPPPVASILQATIKSRPATDQDDYNFMYFFEVRFQFPQILLF